MAENKETYLARKFKEIVDFMSGKEVNTKLAAAQVLKVKDGEAIEIAEDGTVTSGQADGNYVLEDGSTVTIQDGKAGEVKPADKAEESNSTAADESTQTEEIDNAEVKDEPKEGDDLAAEVQSLKEALAAALEEIKTIKDSQETKLAAVETKLSAATTELEEIKRLPADNKQGAITLLGEQKDISKMSVAERAIYAVQNLK
jgi:D-alanyl-D-alanine carboxypeptidase